MLNETNCKPGVFPYTMLTNNQQVIFVSIDVYTANYKDKKQNILHKAFFIFMGAGVVDAETALREWKKLG